MNGINCMECTSNHSHRVGTSEGGFTERDHYASIQKPFQQLPLCVSIQKRKRHTQLRRFDKRVFDGFLVQMWGGWKCLNVETVSGWITALCSVNLPEEIMEMRKKKLTAQTGNRLPRLIVSQAWTDPSKAGVDASDICQQAGAAVLHTLTQI